MQITEVENALNGLDLKFNRESEDKIVDEEQMFELDIERGPLCWTGCQTVLCCNADPCGR